jgi:hypothetical protein
MEKLTVAPNSPRQVEFFASPEYEVLYGGAAGGGKSWSLVIDPLQYINYSQYVATIFRRTYPQLLKSIVPQCQTYYPAAGGTYNEQKKTWKFPSGAEIRLGVMEHEEDWQNFQGDESCGQYYDELTTFYWKQYKMLATWNRSKVPGLPPYRRATSNPGGLSHSQVKAYFVDTCRPVPDGERVYSQAAGMWWQPMKPGPAYYEFDERGRQISRRFIPAKVFDNEDMLRNNPNYLSQLLQLPPEKRRAYLEGDWDVFEGMFFEDWHSDIHVIEPPGKALIKSMPKHSLRGGLDYGQRTVLEVQYRDYEGNIVQFAESYTEKQTPVERADAMAEMLLELELFNLMIRYDTNMEHNLQYYTGYDKAPIELFRKHFEKKMGKRAPIMVVVSKKSEHNQKFRVVCNEAFKQYIHFEKDANGQFIVRPKFFSSSVCRHFNLTVPELIHDPDKADGLDYDEDVGEDDPYEAGKYAFMDLRQAVLAPEKRKYETMDEYMREVVFKKVEAKAMRSQPSVGESWKNL